VMESSSLGNCNVRVSPPLRSSNCWGEQRASFSDVVARNDSPLYSSIVAPHKRTQQSQQQCIQVASSLSACNSTSNSNTARKVPEPATPANITAALGEYCLLTQLCLEQCV
jgi:hypothetical protein